MQQLKRVGTKPSGHLARRVNPACLFSKIEFSNPQKMAKRGRKTGSFSTKTVYAVEKI
jgi:hypothetical protein